MNLDTNNLKAFFRDRPSLSMRGVEREAGLPESKLKEVLRGKQKLSSLQRENLEEILRKYGWVQPKGLAALLADDYTPMGVPKRKKNYPKVGINEV